MSRPHITVSPRSATGKGFARRLRAAGSIPAVLYGNKKEAIALTADPKVVAGVLNGEKGRNATIDLQVTGEKGTRLAIIKDFALHPWKRRLQHVDFWEVSPDQTLTLDIPFERSGKSEAERLGATITAKRTEIRVRCKPADIPAKLYFDVGTVSADDQVISVSSVPMPEGVEAIFKQDYAVLEIKMPTATADDDAEDEDSAAKAQG